MYVITHDVVLEYQSLFRFSEIDTEKKAYFFRDRFEGNIERLETTYIIFQSFEQNMAWKKSMNVLSHQVQNCVGTHSGGFGWGKSEGKGRLRKPKSRWDDNNKMNL